MEGMIGPTGFQGKEGTKGWPGLAGRPGFDRPGGKGKPGPKGMIGKENRNNFSKLIQIQNCNFRHNHVFCEKDYYVHEYYSSYDDI